MAKGKYAQRFANQYRQDAFAFQAFLKQRPMHHVHRCSVPVSRNLISIRDNFYE